MSRPRKSEYTALIQTLVTPKTARRLEAASKREGLSVSAYLRRMLLEWELVHHEQDRAVAGP